jgi:hypothetical protein
MNQNISGYRLVPLVAVVTLFIAVVAFADPSPTATPKRKSTSGSEQHTGNSGPVDAPPYLNPKYKNLSIQNGARTTNQKAQKDCEARCEKKNEQCIAAAKGDKKKLAACSKANETCVLQCRPR